MGATPTSSLYISTMETSRGLSSFDEGAAIVDGARTTREKQFSRVYMYVRSARVRVGYGRKIDFR